MTDLQRVTRQVRRRLSAEVLFLDPTHDPARAVLLIGSARSGTTKLAEMLASARTTRMVFEPLHPRNSPLLPGRIAPGTYRAVDADDDEEPAFLDAWTRALDGRFRSPRTDRHNRSRWASRRVVKCIVATNLVAWLRSRFPAVPIVYVHRHPLAVAHSVSVLAQHERGWSLANPGIVARGFPFSGLLDGPLADRADAIRALGERIDSRLIASVARWCHDNWLPLCAPPDAGFLCVRYEDFVDDPVAWTRRMGEFAGLDVTRGLGSTATPSRTDWSTQYRDPATGSAGRRDGWRDAVPAEVQQQAREALAVFGLDGIVGD